MSTINPAYVKKISVLQLLYSTDIVMFIDLCVSAEAAQHNRWQDVAEFRPVCQFAAQHLD